MTDDELRELLQQWIDEADELGNTTRRMHLRPSEVGDVGRMLLELLPPADDGDKLSSGWLYSVGSDDESPACVSGHYFSLPDGSRLFLWGDEDEHWWAVTLTAHPELDRNADDVSGEIALADIRTRGEFRRLAAALGITLTEPTP